MTESENQDASSKKRFKICDNDGPPPWSDLNQDVLFLVMMQLIVIDFPAFSGVCKSWRSFALSNKSKFMESRPPMSITISTESSEEDYYCYLEDIEERSLILPHSGGRTCVGFTCDHLVFLGKEANDFWLLDPVTRHGIHFPDIPSSVTHDPKRIKTFLFISPSMSGWVFVMTDGSTNIWFSISGQGTWNHVSSTFSIVDLHVFHGKIYTINNSRQFCEMSLNPEPKLTLLETKNFPEFPTRQKFISRSESLYVMRYLEEGCFEFHKLDFEKMKWLLCERKRKTGTSSHRKLKHTPDVKHGKSKSFIWKHMVHPKIV